MSTNTRKAKFSNLAILGTSFIGLIGICFLSFNHYREKYWQQSLDSLWNEFEQWEDKQQHLRKQLSAEQERWISQILSQRDEIRNLREDLKNISDEVTRLLEINRTLQEKKSASSELPKVKMENMVNKGHTPRPMAIREKPPADPNFFD